MYLLDDPSLCLAQARGCLGPGIVQNEWIEALPASLNPLQYGAEVGQIVNSLGFAGRGVSAVISDLPLAQRQPETLCNCLSWLCSYKTSFTKTGTPFPRK